MIDGRSDLVQRMIDISNKLYVSQVQAQLGEDGVAALRRLLTTIRDIYTWIPCETMTDGLTIYVQLADDLHRSHDGSSLLGPSDLASMRLQQATIHIEKDGRLRVWSNSVKPSMLPTRSVGYYFKYGDRPGQCVEVISIGNSTISVVNASGFPSAFGIPTFSNLMEALRHYGTLVQAPDPYMEVAWRDQKRLAFLPKPEKQMRRSLEYYLRQAIRGAKVLVRPEQNVNETEPVDIEVTWPYQGRIAWIEIKWLGCSGPAGSTSWSTTYSASRAVSGAKQLADYLTSGAERVSIPVLGYLVVFDARRRSLTPSQTIIDVADGMYYQLRDVQYPPEILSRPDIAEPVRYFIAPICTY